MSNLSYIEELYRQWQQDASSVDGQWDVYFRQAAAADEAPQEAAPAPSKQDMAYRQGRVDSLLWAYRDIGYLYAKLNPLGGDYGPEHDYLRHDYGDVYQKLTLDEFKVSADDLDTVFSAGPIMKPSPAPLRDILESFRQTYCGSIGAEFLHIQNKHVRRWLLEKMELAHNRPKLKAAQKRIILQDLLRTEALEQTLGRAFVGQKRFSLEGSESIIPGLHFLVDSANKYGVEEFVIGTTHRGRLAILNTIMHMTPQEIFSRFEENFHPGSSGGTGDVKYHIGYETDHVLDDGGRVHISMAANASHLESINAIVQGKARALQDGRHGKERRSVLPILLHGDAAFSGQGVVAETLNLSRLPGYKTGGTIHIIINNQIGFTTSSRNARSSIFPTDLAKAMGVPIFHINGDDPEAVVYAADLALQYRQMFGGDCVLDVFCYRRYGHNEADDPSFTHPRMYELIKEHPGVATIYGRQCAEAGVADVQQQDGIKEHFLGGLNRALADSRSEPVSQIDTTQGPGWSQISAEYCDEPVDTTVERSTLERIADHIMTVPEGFHVHPVLWRILKRKRKSFEEASIVDWAMAESLAFGSLLTEGIGVRLSGEDSARGTFSQRHLVWWDSKSDRPRSYTALETLEGAKARMAAVDSPLSEYSVLGFEYGYSLVDPGVLVMWEAQFGDFANGAEVVIDNYIASAESKWGRLSGLVLLLPHGSEGQGPDHSSGHLERFLQLSACNNIQVCNVTTAAQYFHLLRRQVKAGFRKPLVIMTPKSLLRRPEAVSVLSDLAEGGFEQVLDDSVDPGGVVDLILCSGKVYYDLDAKRQQLGRTDTAVIRIEQLYPLPDRRLEEVLQKYKGVRSVRWVQEEPRNAGGWSYMHERFSQRFPQIDLKYCGRGEGASSAGGSFKQYRRAQDWLIAEALGISEDNK